MIDAAIARIIIRYVVGLVVGASAAQTMAGDSDIVTIVAAVISALGGVATEIAYTLAKKYGWTT